MNKKQQRLGQYVFRDGLKRLADAIALYGACERRGCGKHFAADEKRATILYKGTEFDACQSCADAVANDNECTVIATA